MGEALKILVISPSKRRLEALLGSLSENAPGHHLVGRLDRAINLPDWVDEIEPDAIIMDVMMPRLDGLETTRMLRDGGNDTPILILTARDAVGDRVDGLDAGADDYMVKPFALDELLARLRALTRRSKPAAEAESKVLTFQDVTLDTQHREVTRGGQHISLTRTEFALLQVFMENPRRVMERNTLLNEVWGFEFPTTANSLEVYIGYLRRKTETGGRPRLIHTVRGIGYVLRETPP